LSTRSLRRFTTVAALALAAMVAAPACTSAGAVKPMPHNNVSTASPGVASPAPPASLPANPRPEQVALPATRPLTGPACLGAVIHRVDASDTGPPWKPLCLTVGGVLLVTNLGPDGFSASSWDNVECNYAAGVRECRLLHPGTVTFTIVNEHQTRTLTLVIIKASSPPKPSPACMAAGTTLTIDAADGGPQRWPVCMKLNTVVRVVNLGPEGFLVRPAGAVTCTYEAAVRVCHFTRPQTVTFTTTHGDSAPRTQTVVVIR
jgi:hypothetical protein